MFGAITHIRSLGPSHQWRHKSWVPNLQNVITCEQFVSKHCGCEFVSRVVKPYAKKKDASLSLVVEDIKGSEAKLYLRNHLGHEP